MPNLEHVVDGLRCCAKLFRSGVKRETCAKCPYVTYHNPKDRDEICMVKLMEDAVKLLDGEKGRIISTLMKHDEPVLSLAMLYASSIHGFDVDITQKWDTATQQAEALYKAYNRGFAECEKQHANACRSCQSRPTQKPF